jgi:hypothetical protein
MTCQNVTSWRVFVPPFDLPHLGANYIVGGFQLASIRIFGKGHSKHSFYFPSCFQQPCQIGILPAAALSPPEETVALLHVIQFHRRNFDIKLMQEFGQAYHYAGTVRSYLGPCMMSHISWLVLEKRTILVWVGSRMTLRLLKDQSPAVLICPLSLNASLV